MISCSYVAVAVFVVYLSHSIWNFYNLMNPMHNIHIENDEPVMYNLWDKQSSVSAEIYLSTKKSLPSNFHNLTHPPKGVALIAAIENLEYSPQMQSHQFQIKVFGYNAKADQAKPIIPPENSSVDIISQSVWEHLMKNNTAFLHVFMFSESHTSDLKNKYQSTLGCIHEILPLTFYGPPPNTKPLRFLLKENASNVLSTHLANARNNSMYVSFWKPQASVHIVTDWSVYPLRALPSFLTQSMKIVGLDEQNRLVAGKNWKKLAYLPAIHADETGLTSDMYMPINATLNSLPLRLSIEPMGMARWRLMQHMDQSFKHTKDTFDFSDSDIDDMRRLVTDTNVYLLAVTLLATSLHLLFEFLAFKSDIEFWKKNKSLKGLSIGSITAEFIFQIVIVLYLIEENSSILVLVPMVIGVLLQMWKLKKATGFTFKRNPGSLVFYPSLPRLAEEKKNSEKTSEIGMGYDKLAITYLCLFLLPGVVGFSLQSLITQKYTGWYSWAIRSLTGCVYTLGFVLMTPQLYINYKLKSVAHLPWRFLCYRFMNTFIDDLFAFLIRQPMMHRVSCFRDDIVFLAYLYQRWVYPIDSKRPIAVEDVQTNK